MDYKSQVLLIIIMSSFCPSTKHHHRSLHEELYVLTQFNIICNRVVIQTVVGHRINHVKGREWMKGICPSF